ALKESWKRQPNENLMSTLLRFLDWPLRARMAASLAAAALVVGGTTWIARTSLSHPVGPLERVTIANTRYAGMCPIYVATDEGYFASEGLLVAIQPHSNGMASL